MATKNDLFAHLTQEGVERGYALSGSFLCIFRTANEEARLGVGYERTRHPFQSAPNLEYWRIAAAFEIEGCNVRRLPNEFLRHVQDFPHVHNLQHEPMLKLVVLYTDAYDRHWVEDLDREAEVAVRLQWETHGAFQVAHWGTLSDALATVPRKRRRAGQQNGRLGHVAARGRTVPLEIVHVAAPCRNVPVTFTLDIRKCSLRLASPWSSSLVGRRRSPHQPPEHPGAAGDRCEGPCASGRSVERARRRAWEMLNELFTLVQSSPRAMLQPGARPPGEPMPTGRSTRTPNGKAPRGAGEILHLAAPCRLVPVTFTLACMSLAIVFRNTLHPNRFRNAILAAASIPGATEILICSGFYQDKFKGSSYLASSEGGFAKKLQASGADGCHRRSTQPDVDARLQNVQRQSRCSRGQSHSEARERSPVACQDLHRQHASRASVCCNW